jgi:hypothetical protein
MSAHTETFTVYAWYCIDCNAGGDDCDVKFEAKQGANDHNTLYHPEKKERREVKQDD